MDPELKPGSGTGIIGPDPYPAKRDRAGKKTEFWTCCSVGL